jgi:hypothetical protein
MLRPEARALEWIDLDNAQQDAVKKVVALMVEAIDRLQPGERKKRTPAPAGDLFLIDEDRSSRMVLLSGERGTGKTSVLLSLKRLIERHRQTPAPPSDGDGPKKGQPEKDVEDRIIRLARQVVWLEPIDMEPLAEPTNLLAAILARLSAAADARSGGEEGQGHHGLLEPSPAYHQALLKLRRLETSVALAWDGNLADRGAQLDPDNFAVEVMRTERARLSLNPSLHQALESLAGKVFCGRGTDGVTNPLFVLPVDDFDLNPLRCLELLRVLRMISVPRLFTLVLGDEKVAEAMLSLKLSGDFAKVAAQSFTERISPLSAEEVRNLAGEVAANALRKLLPPGQIIRLEAMRPAEVLKFRPPGSPPGAHSLYQIFQHCPLMAKSPFQEAYRMKGLDGFFIVEPHDMLKREKPGAHSADSDELKKLEQSPYTAKAFLRMPPRRVADLWQELQWRATKDKAEDLQPLSPTKPELTTIADAFRKVSDIVDVFGHHCRRSIAEDSRLTFAGRQRLLKAISKNADGHWELDPGAFEMTVKVGPTYSIKPESLIEAVQEVRVWRTGGWRFETVGESERVSMEDSTAAALLVLHDLLILANLDAPQNLWEEMVRKRTLSWPVPVTRWQWEGKTAEIPWCKARWSSIREFDFLFHHLEQVIEWLMGLREPGENAGGNQPPGKRKEAWKELECLFFALVDANYVTLEWSNPAGFNKGEPDWDTLTNNLIKLFGEVKKEQAGQVHKSQYTIFGWFIELAVLLMPEILGSDANLREAIDQHLPAAWSAEKKLLDLYDFWVGQAREIRHMRCQNLAKLVEGGLPELAEALRTCSLPNCFSNYEKGKAGAAKRPRGKTTASERFTPKKGDVPGLEEALNKTPK